MLQLVVRTAGDVAFDGSTLRLLMYGTAPMPPTTITRLMALLPQTMLLNLYGLTEGGSAVCALAPHEARERPDSVGKPLPPTQVRVTDDAGHDVAPGVAGEVWLRTSVGRRSYFRDEGATAEAWTEDGWTKTGDIGRLDEEGYLYLVDRKKDLIIRGGHNVSPLVIEAALMEHPQISDAAVVGIPHEVLGEDTKAFVVADGPAPSREALMTFLEERVADFEVPRTYAFVDALPRSDIGKVLKRVLKERS
jgi:acyl-CoA synthetase (AMP-forming)/AMP-acid ligase II